MKKTSLGVVLAHAIAAFLVCATGAVAAQEYPARTIQLIVPFPPGGPTDIVGRLVAQRLSDGLGRPVVVENRPGAGGTVGSTAAAKAAPDGYTLLFGSTSTLAIAPSLYKNLPYDPRTAFAPISLVSRGAIVLAINSAVPATTLAEFIAEARRSPGKLAYASAGSGTPPHLAAEFFKSVAGVDLLHVPYKGGAQALTDVASGQTQAIFEGLVTLAPQIRAGRIRALAISGERRDPSLADVPTFAQAGLPQYDAYFWSGLVAPAGTPADIIQRLNAVLVQSLDRGDVREGFEKQGLQTSGSSPQSFGAFIASEVERWARVAKASGAQLD
ncbi:MAG: Bug family tripartite tricarboxylate transporter substrate binding protein [Betaproteobacteria bacterium]